MSPNLSVTMILPSVSIVIPSTFLGKYDSSVEDVLEVKEFSML